MNYIKCPKCQSEIEGDSYFCDQCGAELFVCPKCGTYGKGKRCTRCGEPLLSAKDVNKADAASKPAASTDQSAASANQSVDTAGNGYGNGMMNNPQPSGSSPASSQSSQPSQPQSSTSSPKPNPASITSDIDRILNSNGPASQPTPNAGATVRPGGSPQPSLAANAQRQVPGHLVCRSPQLRLYIDDVLIGRREGGYASVFCAFGMVSGRHAQISRTPNGGWQVMDLGSTNGTKLNGRPLSPNVPAPFWVGDVISFADKDFEAVP